ncbi:hypothetical protein FE257_006238 [Aspergillus nanangensis]|uniref:Transcription factor domain-containing protein n=1 Tax=Aspergillus nanangensis TaxID=2582783 RepID=A0AAD4CPG7_ASPNN|nr:hypothetical protein FE257_006238 [Aspergillus nanangensis]
MDQSSQFSHREENSLQRNPAMRHMLASQHRISRDQNSSIEQAGRFGLSAQLDHHGTAAEPSSRASPELTQMDLEGHYVGGASGVSFILRIQRKLHRTPSYFSFCDIPLPEFDPTFCLMLSKDDTVRLLQRYFNFTAPVDRFIHQPTVEKWLDEFRETMGAMRNDSSAPARRALLWMIFALSQEHMSRDPAALNATNRIFHDEDIDQELPSTLDDWEIHENPALRQSNGGTSAMLAPVAHFRHFLFSRFARLDDGRGSKPESPHNKAQVEEGVKECLQAAMGIVDCVNEQLESGQMFQTFWFTIYYSFSAMVVLYVYAIQHTGPSEVLGPYLEAATRCKNQMSDAAEPDSLPSRYCLVLEELRLEAVGRPIQPSIDNNSISETSGTVEVREDPAPMNDNGGSSVLMPEFENQESALDFNASPPSPVINIPDWMELESMIFPPTASFGPDTQL